MNVYIRTEPPPERLRSICLVCFRRQGMHRFGNNACPNPAWRVGNGEPQWHSANRFNQRGGR